MINIKLWGEAESEKAAKAPSSSLSAAQQTTSESDVMDMTAAQIILLYNGQSFLIYEKMLSSHKHVLYVLW